MKLFLLTQDAVSGYDTYDAIVVTAEDEESAKCIDPYGGHLTLKSSGWLASWPNSPDQVTAKYLGEAAPGTGSGVILASFGAG